MEMRFHHVCNPCDDCESTGAVSHLVCDTDGCAECQGTGLVVCGTCEGASSPCDCRGAWEAREEAGWR
jgi:hypothetical protein